MRVMIFAAGLGTRLYPITKDKPKALAPFLGETLLSYNLKFLAKQGVAEFVINTHHFAERIEEYLKTNQNFGLKIQLSHEEELLDTAGGLAKAKHFFGSNEDILLYNVDVISNIDLQKMHQKHIAKKAVATLAVRERSTSRYLLFDEQDTLSGWRNKNSGEEIWCRDQLANIQEKAFSGIHFINTSLLNDIPLEKLSITPLYLEIAKNQNIVGYNHDQDYWFDCGKPENLEQAGLFVNSLNQ